MLDWLAALSIRWKVHFGSFAVTVATVSLILWGEHGPLAGTTGLLADTADIALLLIAFIVTGLLARHFTAPLVNLRKTIEHIERGDLRIKLQGGKRDELGVLDNAVHALITGLTEMMRVVEECGRQTAQSSHQVAAISREITEASRQEQSRANEVSEATEQLSQTSSAVTSLAEEAAQRTAETEHQASSGVRTMQQNIDKMEDTARGVGQVANEVAELNSAAEKIFHIIETIQNIAEQTNLLALNAAIEAARAGEQGRGFAVVADEVRNLANRTTTSTVEITEIIGKLKTKVDQVSKTMEVVVDGVHTSQESARESQHAIEQLVADVVETSTRSNQRIQEVGQEQLERLETLRSGLERLFTTIEESTAKVQTTETIGEDIHVVAERLTGVIAQFSFERNNAVKSTDDEKRRAPRVSHSLRMQVVQGERTFEATSSDFSMTGAKLRVNEPVTRGDELLLNIYIPYPDLNQYRSQQPLRVRGYVRWAEEGGKFTSCGVEFEPLSAEQERWMTRCFDYFNKTPYYVAPA